MAEKLENKKCNLITGEWKKISKKELFRVRKSFGLNAIDVYFVEADENNFVLLTEIESFRKNKKKLPLIIWLASIMFAFMTIDFDRLDSNLCIGLIIALLVNLFFAVYLLNRKCKK